MGLKREESCPSTKGWVEDLIGVAQQNAIVYEKCWNKIEG